MNLNLRKLNPYAPYGGGYGPAPQQQIPAPTGPPLGIQGQQFPMQGIQQGSPSPQAYTFGQAVPTGPAPVGPLALANWQTPGYGQHLYGLPAQQQPQQFDPAPQQWQPYTVGQPAPQPVQQYQPTQPYQAQQAAPYWAQPGQWPPAQQAPVQQQAPAPAVQPTAPAPAAPAPPAVPFTLGIGLDPAAQAQQAQFILEQQRAQALVDLAKKDPEAALRQQAQHYQEQLQTYRGAVTNQAKQTDLTNALFGTTFVSEKAAKDTLVLLADKFESRLGADGQFVTVEKSTGQPVQAVIKQILARDFPHVIGATTQGGGPPSQGNFLPATQAGSPNMTEAEKNWYAWRDQVQTRYPMALSGAPQSGQAGQSQPFQLNGFGRN